MSSSHPFWWVYIPLALLLVLICVYCSFCVSRLIAFFLPKHASVIRIASAPLAVLLLFLAVRFQTAYSLGLIYWLLFSGIAALIALLVAVVCRLGGLESPLTGASVGARVWASGLIPLAFAVAFTAWGVWNMNRVRATEYAVSSEKLTAPYRVVFISDTHYGTVQNRKALREAAAEISAARPDLVILGGDVVDDSTTADAMREAFATLGAIDAVHGVYYVYGNHDRQIYSSRKKYTEDELSAAIESAGITILRDEAVAVGDDLLLYGREDASRSGDPAGVIAAEISASAEGRFVLMADHQPSRFRENAAAGADLQLSGHTHAFQIWPAGLLLKHFMYCYGEYREGDARLFVSSGFAGWGYPIRTEKFCEYLDVTLTPAE